VSFHAYNDEHDVDAVLEALDAEAALVQRARETIRSASGGSDV
jgi:selenocysteine lyase/cysteine desulfurase